MATTTSITTTYAGEKAAGFISAALYLQTLSNKVVLKLNQISNLSKYLEN